MAVYKTTVYYTAEDEAEAEAVVERIINAACNGTGEGAEHVCGNLLVSTGPYLVEDDEEQE